MGYLKMRQVNHLTVKRYHADIYLSVGIPSGSRAMALSAYTLLYVLKPAQRLFRIQVRLKRKSDIQKE